MRILLIEDNEDDVVLVREMLARAPDMEWELERAESLEGGLRLLERESFDTVLLDLFLPDSRGIETFQELYSHVPGVPIIVLSALHDDELATSSVQQGAQDYLVKGDVTPRALSRVLRYAVERKRADEASRFQAQLLGSVRESVVATDLEGRITYWGKGAESLYGYPAHEVLGKPVFLIVGSGEEVTERERMQHVLEHGSWSGQYVQRRRDGSEFWADTVISLVTDPDGKPTGFVGIDRDITERREFEEALKKAKDAADVANVAKTSFLANMSHELRTPMNVILGYTELVRDRLRDDRAAIEDLAAIERSAAHLLELIEDVLDLSKIEAEKLEIEQISCVTLEVVDDVLSLMELPAAEKGIHLSWRCETPVPERIISDPTRIRQALLNLVGNAIKYSEAGTVEISLQLAERDGQSVRLEFRVKDTGLGIPAEKLKEIFEPFSQVDDSSTRKHGGSGLGLAISRRLAELLGGELSVQSAPGLGSCFTFAIRARIAEDGSLVSAGSRHWSRGEVDDMLSAPPPEPAALRGRVLVVEDTEENRKLMQIELEQAGLEVDVAEDGAVALETCRKLSYDLILMDLRMPVLDGFKTLNALRLIGIDTPVVAVTAHAMRGDRERCMEAGFNWYLSKPVKRQKLLETVEAFLKQGETRTTFSRHSFER